MTTVNARDPAWSGGAVGDGITDDTAAIQAAINAAATTGGQVFLGPGSFKISTLSFAGKSNVLFKGSGWDSTFLLTTDTTGNVLDFTNSSFCSVEDLMIRPYSAQRTAGALINLAPGTGSCQRNRFSRLRLSSGFKGIYMNGATTVMVEDIEILDFNATWTWDSAIQVDGATRSVVLRRISGGSAATVNQALIYINGSTVDTVLSEDCDLLNFSPSTGCPCLKITNGEWIRFTNFSAESGTTQDAVAISGGQGITFTGVHLIGLRGANISGGKGIVFNGGEVVKCQQGGIRLAAGAAHVTLANLKLSDNSEASTTTYNGIDVAAGVTDFQVIACEIGNWIFGTSRVANGINVAAGASDRYTILANVFQDFSSSSVADAGTGTVKMVESTSSLGIGHNKNVKLLGGSTATPAFIVGDSGGADGFRIFRPVAASNAVRIEQVNNAELSLRVNAADKLRLDNTGLAFYGTAPAAKPTVTGAKGANAALASLLTALAGLGLLTDSSTA